MKFVNPTMNIRGAGLAGLSDPRLRSRSSWGKRAFSLGVSLANRRAMRLLGRLSGCLLIVSCSGGSISIDASPETETAGGQSGGKGGATGGSSGKTSDGGGTTGGTLGDKDAGGADAGLSCAQIETMYNDALTAARRCKVGATDQCRSTASPGLSGCFVYCVIPVNDNLVVNELKAEWTQAHCDVSGRPIVCPAIACLPPKGVCQSPAGAGDSGGLCMNQGLATQ